MIALYMHVFKYIVLTIAFFLYATIISFFLMVAGLSPLPHQDCKDIRSKGLQYLLLVDSTV